MNKKLDLGAKTESELDAALLIAEKGCRERTFKTPEAVWEVVAEALGAIHASSITYDNLHGLQLEVYSDDCGRSNSRYAPPAVTKVELKFEKKSGWILQGVSRIPSSRRFYRFPVGNRELLGTLIGSLLEGANVVIPRGIETRDTSRVLSCPLEDLPSWLASNETINVQDIAAYRLSQGDEQ